MRRSDFEAKLRELEATARPALARSLWHELSEAVAWIDEELQARCRNVVQGRGLVWKEQGPVHLRLGETWLLLHEEPSAGRAVRLRAEFRSTEGDPYVQAHIDRSYRALLGAAARSSRHLELKPVSLDIDTRYRWGSLRGSSLGLSVAVALASLELAEAAASDVAASACLDEAGKLAPVEHLDFKLDALRCSWPSVKRVVVAPGQASSPEQRRHFELLERHTLEQALRDFGLELGHLPAPARLNVYRSQVGTFRDENEGNHHAREWQRLSLLAGRAGAALARDEPIASAQALFWSALFALHAGDAASAAAILGEVPETAQQAYPALFALRLIVCAAVAIDEEPSRGIVWAAQAVGACRALDAESRERLLGQALGTHGRALLHAGNPGGAQPLLEGALEHHQQFDPKEAARSACYLATCERLCERPEKALQLLDAAMAKAGQFAERGWELGLTTRRYLLLERGRTLGALGRWQEAKVAFEQVIDHRGDDASYPHLGGLRGLAHALRQLGATEHCDTLVARCSRVARENPRSTLAQVAVLAVGEALLDEAPASLPERELHELWQAVFGETITPDRVRARLRTAVY